MDAIQPALNLTEWQRRNARCYLETLRGETEVLVDSRPNYVTFKRIDYIGVPEDGSLQDHDTTGAGGLDSVIVRQPERAAAHEGRVRSMHGPQRASTAAGVRRSVPLPPPLPSSIPPLAGGMAEKSFSSGFDRQAYYSEIANESARHRANKLKRLLVILTLVFATIVVGLSIFIIVEFTAGRPTVRH
ncbi:hypothetical protein PYCC9005_001247 [Savitreella phatthalungensis]